MAKKNLYIQKGSTFSEVFRWESPLQVYKTITNITNTAPVVVTAVGHGLPQAWRGTINNVSGMTDINSNNIYYELTTLTTDTFEINAVNAAGFKTYISGGTLQYPEPINLAGYTADMQIRSDISSDIVLLECSTTNGYIIIDSVNSTITINIPAAITTDLTFNSGVYSLELTSSGGQVTTLLTGGVAAIDEVTR